MSLETLRKQAADNLLTVNVNGSDYLLRKMNAKSYVEFTDKRLELGKDTDVFVYLLSKTLCDESGELDCDSDEGRSLIRKLSVDQISKLGNAAAEWSMGVKPQEKNLAPSSDTASSSV